MTASDEMHQDQRIVIFSYGFRPFFLFGALWAALAMLLWILMLAGTVTIPTRLDPVSWHAHAFLFGYLGAIIAGFLLTAVPNWTGRAPLSGRPLAALFTLWLVGRLAIALSALLPIGVAEAVDLTFPIALGGVILREIIVGKNWRNLIILVLLGLFTLANLLFHLDAAHGRIAAQGLGLRLGIATILMLIAVIGGRIVPSFTRNWLVKAGRSNLPPPPMQAFDKLALLGGLVALALWSLYPDSAQSGIALIGMALLHFFRLFRWKGHHTLSEPLLSVLHLGYLFVPLGALVEGLAILRPDLLAPGSAQHLWMAGAFAMMTLAVMTRATLGHTGQALHAGSGSILMFLSVLGAVAFRLAVAIWPENAMTLYALSGTLWITAFVGFCFLFGKCLIFGVQSET